MTTIRKEMARSRRTLPIVFVNADNPGAVDPFDCDIAIVGAFAVARRAVLSVLREKLGGRPAVLLVDSVAADPLFDGTFAAIARSEMHLLPHVVRREVELHRAVQALRRSEERYRQLIDNIPDIVWRVNTRGQITFVTANVEELTGFTVEELMRDGMRVWLKRIHPADAERVMATHGQTFNLGSHDVEYRFSCKDGHWIWLRDRAVVSDHGGPPEAIGTLTDMTGRRLAEQERKAMEAELEKEKRLASLGHLAASVAHEFNNVLMSILPFAELLRRRAPNDERVDHATTHIIQAVRRGRQVSQEILRLARPAALSLVEIDAHQWLARFAHDAQTMLGEKYHVRSGIGDEEILFRGDRALVDQVATSLIANARDAMPDGGIVTIRVSRVRNGPALLHEPAGTNHVEVSVQDTGAGIAPELIDHVFDPLFTTKSSASGLGLSIAHQAMTKQGGLLRLRSEVGVGSTFSMVFREAAPSASAPATPVLRKADGKRILIVEDDPSVGEGLGVLLGDEGFEVKLVTNGRAAVEAAAQFGADLVLLDVNLPDISGVQVFSELRSRWPDIKIIFSTGHADTRAIDELRDLQVPSIMKPYDLGELLTVIASLDAPGDKPESET